MLAPTLWLWYFCDLQRLGGSSPANAELLVLGRLEQRNVMPSSAGMSGLTGNPRPGASRDRFRRESRTSQFSAVFPLAAPAAPIGARRRCRSSGRNQSCPFRPACRPPRCRRRGGVARCAGSALQAGGFLALLRLLAGRSRRGPSGAHDDASWGRVMNRRRGTRGWSGGNPLRHVSQYPFQFGLQRHIGGRSTRPAEPCVKHIPGQPVWGAGFS